MNAFRERAKEKEICFATLKSIAPNADDAKFDAVIKDVRLHNKSSRVIVCMCEGRTTRQLLAALKRANASNEFLIVGR